MIPYLQTLHQHLIGAIGSQWTLIKAIEKVGTDETVFIYSLRGGGGARLRLTIAFTVAEASEHRMGWENIAVRSAVLEGMDVLTGDICRPGDALGNVSNRVAEATVEYQAIMRRAHEPPEPTPEPDHGDVEAYRDRFRLKG